MSWFHDLVGFRESRAAVYANLSIDGEWMTSSVNGRRLRIGALTTPSLAELRAQVGPVDGGGPLRVRQVVADVTALHQHPDNVGALFQVASQFNLLEMVGPGRTPEDGVTGYAHDFTQGPACAIAAGAATIYRNYFVPVGAQQGQSADQQLDMLADMGALLGNQDGRLWEMRNGYALCSASGIRVIQAHIHLLDEDGRDQLRQALRIGVHSNVAVTTGPGGGPVTQAFCSALPVAYSQLSANRWESFAWLVLEASYEATLLAAIHNARNGGSPRTFLTSLGGGAFGNRPVWIIESMRRALMMAADAGLDVNIVSYRRADPDVDRLIQDLVRSGVATTD